MRNRWLFVLATIFVLILAACSAADVEPAPLPEATRVVAETVEVEGEPVEVTRIVVEEVAEEEPAEEEQATEQPATTPAPAATPTPVAQPTATLVALDHVAEVEWPPRMRLGESDVVRLALLRAEEGYVVETEFPEHRTVTATVPLQQQAGYDVIAVARLDGVGFDVAPVGEQPQNWQEGQLLTWRWTISPLRAGQQRLSVNLTLHWRPESGRSLASRQLTAFSRSLDVQVLGPLGLTRGQALGLGLAGLLLGVVLIIPTLGGLLALPGGGDPPRRPARLQIVRSAGRPALEPDPSISLDGEEQELLRALFQPYERVVLETEYPSGYSGARTLLALPIHPDGRSDAYTIAKLGSREAIQREVANYERYVADTLPPLTARIQGQPVTCGERCSRGALRYTFVGKPGQLPVSLRERLLAGGDGVLIEHLFRTFGPTWWMQRRPYTFRVAQEYDRKLPAHYLLEPAPGSSPMTILDGRNAPGTLELAAGDRVIVRHMHIAEHKGEGRMALEGEAADRLAPLRLHWLGGQQPDGAAARVVATRIDLLREWTAGFERYGLPDPLAALPGLLATTIRGSRSIIHGDLNLENTLVGPGDAVWLIDFAETREGHTLYDFAHLGAEIVAHILSQQIADPADYVAYLEDGGGPLLRTLANLAARCLYDPQDLSEYRIAMVMACLGALKFRNLDDRARHYLYLTAAHLVGASPNPVRS